MTDGRQDKKTCKKCACVKGTSAFPRNSFKCRECSNEEARAAYWNGNKQRQNENSRRNYNKNKEARLKQIYSRRDATPGGRWERLWSTRNKRKIPINITREDFVKWASENNTCHYCGDIYKDKGTGADRIDSSKGYQLDNIVCCCKWCNQAKSTMTTEAFLTLIEKIYVKCIEKK